MLKTIISNLFKKDVKCAECNTIMTMPICIECSRKIGSQYCVLTKKECTTIMEAIDMWRICEKSCPDKYNPYNKVSQVQKDERDDILMKIQRYRI